MFPFQVFLKTPLEGAQTTIFCAVSEEMEGVTGKYLADCRIMNTSNPQADDDQLAERLWEVSMKLTQSLKKISCLYIEMPCSCKSAPLLIVTYYIILAG